MVSWRVLQLADSAFPVGGFAHSGGLEAALHAGTVKGAADVTRFLGDAVTAAAHGALPLVAAAWDAAQPERIAELDALCAATMWSHVAVRASRAQGRALVDVAARAFAVPSLVALRARVISESEPGHLAVMFGAVLRALDVSREETAATYLHLLVRSMLSAAVRLGALGPTEAQAVHARLDATLTAALALAGTLTVDDLAQTAPLAELVQAGQDRLYTRLFQS